VAELIVKIFIKYLKNPLSLSQDFMNYYIAKQQGLLSSLTGGGKAS